MSSDKELLSQMMTELQTLDKVAVLKEEDNVIRSLLRGKTKKDILRDLQVKHPYETISMKDLNDFIILYKDILYHEKTDIEKGYVRRLLRSKEGLTNELLDLTIKGKEIMNKYDEQGDGPTAVAALRTVADVFMKFAKVEGLTVDQPEININMQMDKIVSQVTTKDSDFKKTILKIIDKPEEKPAIDIKLVEDE